MTDPQRPDYFEKLYHRPMGEGDPQPVPLLMRLGEIRPEESDAIIGAIDIIGANLENYGKSVEEIRDEVAKILKDKSTPVTYTDQFGGGSITVSPDGTTVRRRRIGSWDIPTKLMIEMMSEWVAYIENEKQNATATDQNISGTGRNRWSGFRDWFARTFPPTADSFSSYDESGRLKSGAGDNSRLGTTGLRGLSERGTTEPKS